MTSASQYAPNTSSRINPRDIEPDEVWKANLRREIEDSMLPLWDDAKRKHEQDLDLAKPSDMQRLEAQYKVVMKDLRILAEAQFRERLLREKQERRWAANLEINPEWLGAMEEEQKLIYAQIRQQSGISESPTDERRTSTPTPAPPPMPQLPPPISSSEFAARAARRAAAAPPPPPQHSPSPAEPPIHAEQPSEEHQQAPTNVPDHPEPPPPVPPPFSGVPRGESQASFQLDRDLPSGNLRASRTSSTSLQPPPSPWSIPTSSAPVDVPDAQSQMSRSPASRASWNSDRGSGVAHTRPVDRPLSGSSPLSDNFFRSMAGSPPTSTSPAPRGWTPTLPTTADDDSSSKFPSVGRRGSMASMRSMSSIGSTSSAKSKGSINSMRKSTISSPIPERPGDDDDDHEDVQSRFKKDQKKIQEERERQRLVEKSWRTRDNEKFRRSTRDEDDYEDEDSAGRDLSSSRSRRFSSRGGSGGILELNNEERSSRTMKQAMESDFIGPAPNIEDFDEWLDRPESSSRNYNSLSRKSSNLNPYEPQASTAPTTRRKSGRSAPDAADLTATYESGFMNSPQIRRQPSQMSDFSYDSRSPIPSQGSLRRQTRPVALPTPPTSTGRSSARYSNHDEFDDYTHHGMDPTEGPSYRRENDVDPRPRSDSSELEGLSRKRSQRYKKSSSRPMLPTLVDPNPPYTPTHTPHRSHTMPVSVPRSMGTPVQPLHKEGIWYPDGTEVPLYTAPPTKAFPRMAPQPPQPPRSAGLSRSASLQVPLGTFNPSQRRAPRVVSEPAPWDTEEEGHMDGGEGETEDSEGADASNVEDSDDLAYVAGINGGQRDVPTDIDEEEYSDDSNPSLHQSHPPRTWGPPQPPRPSMHHQRLPPGYYPGPARAPSAAGFRPMDLPPLPSPMDRVKNRSKGEDRAPELTEEQRREQRRARRQTKKEEKEKKEREEQEERERKDRERVREREKKEQEEQERREKQEQAERERRDREEREKRDRERKDREQREERERRQREARDRTEREQLDAERLEIEKAKQELERMKREQERMEMERQRKFLEREKAEIERIAAEKERLEREEQDRLDREQELKRQREQREQLQREWDRQQEVERQKALEREKREREAELERENVVLMRKRLEEQTARAERDQARRLEEDRKQRENLEETKREAAKMARQLKEAQRKAAEAQRVSEEAMASKEEASKQAAELRRQMDEAQRLAQEAHAKQMQAEQHRFEAIQLQQLAKSKEAEAQKKEAEVIRRERELQEREARLQQMADRLKQQEELRNLEDMLKRKEEETRRLADDLELRRKEIEERDQQLRALQDAIQQPPPFLTGHAEIPVEEVELDFTEQAFEVQSETVRIIANEPEKKVKVKKDKKTKGTRKVKDERLEKEQKARRAEELRKQEEEEEEEEYQRQEQEKRERWKQDMDRAEKDRLERLERLDKERREQLERERVEREESQRLEKEETERRQKEETEHRQKEETERRQKEETERRQKEETERLQKEEREQWEKEIREAARLKEEETRRQEDARRKAEKERLDTQRLKDEEKRKREAQESERAHKEEEQRKAQIEEDRLHAEKLNREWSERFVRDQAAMHSQTEAARMQQEAVRVQQEEFRQRAEEELKRRADRKRQDSAGDGAWPNANFNASYGASQTFTSPRSPPPRTPSAQSTSNGTGAAPAWASWGQATSGTASWNSAAASASSASGRVPRSSPTKPRAGSVGAGSPGAPPQPPQMSEAERLRYQAEQARIQQERFRQEQERLASYLHRSRNGSPIKEQVTSTYEKYERMWAALASKSVLRWEDFPWPIIRAPSSPDEISSSGVEDYICSPHYPDKSRNEKDRVKDYIKRWHPDRFETKMLVKVAEDEKEKVGEGAGSVVRILNDLLAKRNDANDWLN